MQLDFYRALETSTEIGSKEPTEVPAVWSLAFEGRDRYRTSILPRQISAPQAAKEEDHYDYEQPALLLGFTARLRRVRFRNDGGVRTDLGALKTHFA